MTTIPRPASENDRPVTGAVDPVPLRLAAVEVVEPDVPFHPRTTLIKPSHFPSPFDAQGEHDYRAVTFVHGQPTGLRASFTDDAPTVRLEIHLPPGAETDPTAAAAVLRARLGLDLALPGYADLCTDDEVLSRLPAAMQGARPSSPWSVYEYLSIGTLLQNTTVARTVQMARALAGLLSTWYRFPDDVVLASFWNPGDVVDLGEAALREAKLGYRAKTLARLGAQFQADPDTETRLRTQTGDPHALRAGLRALYGVGPATTGYLMVGYPFHCPRFGRPPRLLKARRRAPGPIDRRLVQAARLRAGTENTGRRDGLGPLAMGEYCDGSGRRRVSSPCCSRATAGSGVLRHPVGATRS